VVKPFVERRRGTAMRATSVGPSVVILLAWSVVLAQPGPEFRSTEGHGETRWGMTKADVLAVVPDAKEVRGALTADGTVAGKSATTLYLFADDRLTLAGVFFNLKYVNRNNYINDYRELQSLLSKKYGPPRKDETLWSQDLYRKTPQEWGMAIAAGHLVLVSVWETEKTKIELGCTGENFKITLRIRYASKELESLQKRQQEAEKLKGLRRSRGPRPAGLHPPRGPGALGADRGGRPQHPLRTGAPHAVGPGDPEHPRALPAGGRGPRASVRLLRER
jgi:hypothetical protein